MSIEQIRSRFRPSEIDVLFVGESAPASGKFFYNMNSSAFRETRKAFSNYLGRPFGNDEFLDWFRERKFYLDDLVMKPINKEGDKQRSCACTDGIPDLALRIAGYRPKHVVAIAKSIDKFVREALRLSGVHARYSCVSFPGTGQQRNFHRDMEGLLPNLPSLN
jgi:hypothetical protein